MGVHLKRMLNRFIRWLGKRSRSQGQEPAAPSTSMASTTSTSAPAQQCQNGEVEGPKEFMQLPLEVQQRILMTLPLSTVKLCRLVCSKWCDLVDTGFQFSFLFNDQKNDYSEGVTYPPWRITRCFIGSYIQRDLEFLPHPETLTALTIWGSISPENFLRVIRSTPNLEELHLANKALSTHGGSNLLWEVNGTLEQVNLNRLRKLTLSSRERVASLERNLIGVFSQSMPNLVKLKVIMESQDCISTSYIDKLKEIKVATVIAHFISRHRNLRTVHLALTPHIHVTEGHANDLLAHLNETNGLEEGLAQVKLQNCRLKVSPLYIKLLGRLLNVQRELRDIRIEVPYFGVMMPLRYSTLEESILNSLPSLVSIHVECLPGLPFDATPVDLAMFGWARNLKRLILRRWYSERDEGRVDAGANILNLYLLPPSLESLELEGLHCRSQDVILLARKPSMGKLSVIKITQAGTQPGLGIDGSVARALVRKRSLHVLKIGPLKNRLPGRGEDPEYSVLRSALGNSSFREEQTVTFDFRRFRRERALRAINSGEGTGLQKRRQQQSCSSEILSTTL